MLEVLFNGRCSKCRQAVAFLDQHGLPYRLRHYLQEPLSIDELQVLAHRLALPPEQWMREVVGQTLEEQIAVVAARPELLQRPIVIVGERAIVARTPDALTQLLD